ncbi:MAG: nodulation protein NfeD, partial [Rhodothermales bacterium]
MSGQTKRHVVMRCSTLAILLLLVGLFRVDARAQEAGAVAQEVGSVAQETGEIAQASGPVVRARLEDEAITPVTVRYLRRVFEEADELGASAILLELDTPGGLVASTREIVRSFLGSTVPVIVYVAPSGARAASAGVFITVSAHVAAMAPGTHIGAAHPVQMGTGQTDSSGVMEEKILNDTRAWARSLATLRGRNADWVESAVTESLSITAEEALELNVIDLLASSAEDLLDRIDGRTVDLGTHEIVLHTAGAEIVSIDAWWGERVLNAIANPNVAFLLLMLGFYGLLFEFYSPGWGVAGTLGAIFLLLGFTGLSVLPINMIGLLLVFGGLALFVAEAFVPSFGVLTIGGVGCLIMGGIMLVDTPVGAVQVSLELLIPVAVATGAIAFFLMGQVVRAHLAPTQTGSESMIGSDAVVVKDFSAPQAAG